MRYSYILKILSVIICSSLFIFAECPFLADEEKIEDDRIITSFVFEQKNNPSLAQDIPATVTENGIFVTVPAGTPINMLKPTVEHNGRALSPASGEAQNFTHDIVYKVTSHNTASFVPPYRNYRVHLSFPEEGMIWDNAELSELSSGIAGPRGMVMANGRLYVASTTNCSIYRVNPDTGSSELFAGKGDCIGMTDFDGNGTDARFTQVWGMTLNNSFLYVTTFPDDSATTGRIRIIDIDTADVTTFIDFSTSLPMIFQTPMGITGDGENLYVSQYSSIAPYIFQVGLVSRIKSKIAGYGPMTHDGQSHNASFYNPIGLSTDGDILYIGEQYGYIRYMELATGKVTTIGYVPGSVGLTTDFYNLYSAGYDLGDINKISLTEQTFTLYETDTFNKPLQNFFKLDGDGPWEAEGFPCIIQTPLLPGHDWSGGNASHFEISINYGDDIRIELNSNCPDIFTVIGELNDEFANAGADGLLAMYRYPDSINIIKLQPVEQIATGLGQPWGMVIYNDMMYISEYLDNAITVFK